MAPNAQQQLNFVLIPFMSPGHVIPMIDLAKLLAQRGVTVTIVTTPLNAIRFGRGLSRFDQSSSAIRIVKLRFPSAEAGLPEGCENVDHIPSIDFIRNFFVAVDLLQQPFEQLLEELKPGPSCIISDKAFAWTTDTANKFHIPRIVFDGMSCFTQLCMHNLFISKVHESVSELEPFVVPGLPDRIELTRAQLPGAFNPGPMNLADFRDKIRAAEMGAYGVVVNSFEQLEQRYVDEFRKIRRDKVWCIGPLSMCNKDNVDMAHRGNKASINENECLKWLNSWQPGSVVYACLGSLSRLTCPQLIELALGLEASNQPFIWAVRAEGKAKEIEKWIVEEKFEERTRGRGLVIRGWAPQVLILSHPAIGGFLTHCGWNSTLEGVCGGVPMITWPMFAEQFLNEKLVIQVLGTGVCVGVQIVVHLGEEEKNGVKVRREEIKNAIERAMDEGQEGQERKKRARELGQIAKMAIEEGGSSHLNMTLLISDIMEQVNNVQLD